MVFVTCLHFVYGWWVPGIQSFVLVDFLLFASCRRFVCYCPVSVLTSQYALSMLLVVEEETGPSSVSFQDALQEAIVERRSHEALIAPR